MMRWLIRRAGGAAVLGLAWASAQVFGSRALAQVAGFGASVLVARALGPDAFGLYAFMVIAATLLSETPGAGLDLSAVRLSARDWARDPRRARGLLAVSGLTKLACGLALMLLGIALAGPVAIGLLGRPELEWPLRCAAVSALGMAMTDFCLAALQAQERFGRIFAVNLLSAGLKIAPVALLLAVGALDLASALVAFAAAIYAGCALAALGAWRAGGGAARWDRATARELLAFSRWFILATVLGVVTSGLDVLALTHLAGAEATGVYAAARTLALPLAVAGGAVATVLLPRLSRLAAAGAVGPYLRQIGPWLAGGVAATVACLVALAPLLVPLVYGDRYAGAVTIFQVLTLAYGIQILTWPPLLILMVLDRPDIIARLSFAVLCIVGAGYALVVPAAGAVGAAWVYLAGCGLIFVPYVVICWWAVRGDGRALASRPAA